MLFNSITFLIFLPIVFALYWMFNARRNVQNALIIVASYIFYGWWDWHFLILMAFTSLWSYVFGLFELRGTQGSAASKFRMVLSCIINLGILFYFKYAGFFISQATELLQSFGLQPNMPSLQIILPVGISFYTFQALSYTIDVYQRKIKPTEDIIAFFAFISFFPQLVAGPIERATNLLPQFLSKRTFRYEIAVEGLRQVIWGFFKKVIVADTCAIAANKLLAIPNAPTISIWLGMICFAFQIYGDFSGYSDIAIGCGKLFGIRLMRNFAYPYFARDVAEFWRRWHISLTTWFRDYLYIPLGGSRNGKLASIRNTFIIFIVSGVWHGANWTFLVWGLFHACCFVPLLALNKNRRFISDDSLEGGFSNVLRDIGRRVLTFLIIVIGWTWFRAPDISTAMNWIASMTYHSSLNLRQCGICFFTPVIFPVSLLLIIEWMNRSRELPVLPRNKYLRWLIYYVFIFYIAYFHPGQQTFIYFQF